MSDRELLELAAKAAGLFADGYRAVDHELDGWVCVRQPDEKLPFKSIWAPLTDDGDALRLLNKLWLQLRHVHGIAHAGDSGRFWCSECWFPDGDQNAATRRAIVRAAAHVAKAAQIPVTSQGTEPTTTERT